MLVTGFPAGTFQTNCWLVATGPGAEALVVDPGQDALAGIEERCRDHRLKPVAALLTHGHLDHVWTVAPLAGVDDQRLRPGGGRDQPAVRLEGPGGKSGHEHGAHATGTAPAPSSGSG